MMFFMYVFICILSFIYVYQVYNIPLFAFKLIYLLLITLLLIAITYESKFLGCSPGSCTLEKNKSVLSSSQSFACSEAERVNWRRTYIISFIILFIFNCFALNNFELNLVYFLITWSLLYFYFNFEQYHRYSLECLK